LPKHNKNELKWLWILWNLETTGRRAITFKNYWPGEPSSSKIIWSEKPLNTKHRRLGNKRLN
jgi:hypothetical protein